MSAPSSPLPQNPDPGAAYQAAYDALGQAYWDASDINSKDLIHGTQMAIGDILTAINQQQLATNTALFIELTPKIKAVNVALTEIQTDITKITRNINTAATVITAVSKVISLFPGLV